MAWDDTKDTFQSRPDVPDDEKLLSSEWNTHVTDQKNHSGRHEDGGADEISVEGLSGDLADAQDPKQEAVEDFVDELLAAGNAITLTYDDGNGTLTVAVVDGDIDHDALTNFVANEHVDHSTVSIDAGTSLTGGGDLTTSRTLNVDETTIAHDNLSGFVANEHVDHSSVTVTAGNGLVGGGDLTTSRTLDAHNVTVETGDYTASESDIVLADASSSPLTVTLPAADSSIAVTVKKIDASSNTVTIATPGGETIDGDSNRTLTAQYVSRQIMSDGTDYWVI